MSNMPNHFQNRHIPMQTWQKMSKQLTKQANSTSRWFVVYHFDLMMSMQFNIQGVNNCPNYNMLSFYLSFCVEFGKWCCHFFSARSHKKPFFLHFYLYIHNITKEWDVKKAPVTMQKCMYVQNCTNPRGSKETFFAMFGTWLSGVSCLGSLFLSALSEQVTCVLHA